MGAGLSRKLHLMEKQADQNPPSNELESLSMNSQAEGGSSSSCPTVTQMSPEERFQIVRSVGEECIQEDELLNLLTKKPVPICYDGFEPSGRMHIAQSTGSHEDDKCEQNDFCWMQS